MTMIYAIATCYIITGGATECRDDHRLRFESAEACNAYLDSRQEYRASKRLTVLSNGRASRTNECVQRVIHPWELVR
jgi:hypothetical protein